MKKLPFCLVSVLWLLSAASVSSQENPFRVQATPPPTDFVMGRNARLELGDNKLQGELLSVTGDSLWILSNGAVLSFPLREVGSVDVQMHKWGSSRMWKWNLVAGLGSAIALSAACGSVEDSDGCGGFFLAWSGLWTLIGGGTGYALAASSHRNVHPSFEALRPWVRYPQGPPNKIRPGGEGRPSGR